MKNNIKDDIYELRITLQNRESKYSQCVKGGINIHSNSIFICSLSETYKHPQSVMKSEDRRKILKRTS